MKQKTTYNFDTQCQQIFDDYKVPHALQDIKNNWFILIQCLTTTNTCKRIYDIESGRIQSRLIFMSFIQSLTTIRLTLRSSWAVSSTPTMSRTDMAKQAKTARLFKVLDLTHTVQKYQIKILYMYFNNPSVLTSIERKTIETMMPCALYR